VARVTLGGDGDLGGDGEGFLALPVLGTVVWERVSSSSSIAWGRRR